VAEGGEERRPRWGVRGSGTLPEAVAVRDSKDPDGPKLLLTPRTFQTILNSLKQ
jgi:hypothetical protein